MSSKLKPNCHHQAKAVEGGERSANDEALSLGLPVKSRPAMEESQEACDAAGGSRQRERTGPLRMSDDLGRPAAFANNTLLEASSQLRVRPAEGVPSAGVGIPLDELAEYMEACALIARNGADIHPQSKDLRHHANMATAAAEVIREQSDDLVGYSIVAIACNSATDGHEDWYDEFLDWYKPEQWFGSHRAAAVFVGMKYRKLKSSSPPPSNHPGECAALTHAVAAGGGSLNSEI